VCKEKPVPGLCGERTANCLTSVIICMLKEPMLGHMIFSLALLVENKSADAKEN